MSTEEKIIKQIKALYEANSIIHVDVSLSKPKFVIKNAEVRIRGVYPHIFQLEENTGARTICHTVQYTDVMIGNIVIQELKKSES